MNMQNKLSRSDLWSLEQYSEKRREFRSEVIAHKANRKILLGDHVQLIFEDRKTIHYQIQEMLRIEKVFEAAGIQDELDAYNPLIPDGDNLKCSMLIQYRDIEVRAAALQRLLGIEDKVWIAVEGCERVWAIADEDLERSNDEKTSAVHFLRFQFPLETAKQLLAGAKVSLGIDHEHYACETVVLSADQQAALAQDFSV